MIEDFRNRLYEQVSTPQESKEDVSSHSLSTAPSDENPEEQVARDQELPKNFAEDQAAAKQEARNKERAAANEIRGLHEKFTQAMNRFEVSIL
jgi:predicted HNH restriction endonuclease